MRFFLSPPVLAIIWLVAFAPWVSLLHWWLAWPLGYLTAGSALLTPLYTFVSLKALRDGPDWFAFGSMQFLGAGSVGWPLLIPAWLATLFLPQPLVAAAFLVIWACLVMLAIVNAHRIHDISIDIADSRIEKPLRLVQISDVHIGSRSAAFLDKVVARVNSHKPDIVLITGDLLDLSRVDAEELKALGDINAESYMCVGNHERYVNIEKALAAIRSHGVHVTQDEVTVTRGIQIISIDDADKPDRMDNIIKDMDIDHDRFSVVLYHRPDGWEYVKKYQLPLMLAGHTHNGQVWPFTLVVKRRYPEIAGLYQHSIGQNVISQLYVSSGTGTWGPTMRLGTKSEVTIFNLSNKA